MHLKDLAPLCHARLWHPPCSSLHCRCLAGRLKNQRGPLPPADINPEYTAMRAHIVYWLYLLTSLLMALQSAGAQTRAW
jgi:hypothetical protein